MVVYCFHYVKGYYLIPTFIMPRCIVVGMEANFEVCPMALAQNDNVLKFADVDGSAFVFADMPAGTNVRAELDEIFAGTDLSFRTARHASTVDLETINPDCDMLFIYD